jgi:NAD(P)-dependent dehydrogenase (short-subunit alcohol dehydrogenase family)
MFVHPYDKISMGSDGRSHWEVLRHMDLALDGKRAIVTGGTGGIGIAIARQLAQEGVRTAVCSRSLDRAADAIASLGLDEDAELMPVQVELRDPGSVAAMVDTVASRWGGVDIVVNSAAEVSGNVPEDFDHVTDEFVLSAFEDKFLGILRLCRSVVPLMRQEKYGRIINLAGSTARHAGSISAGARNSAVVNLTKALAVHLGRDGITVNAIHPFTTVTENLGPRLERMAARHDASAAEHLRTISAKTSLGRLVTAGEIADFVAFLASPRSIALTGEVLALTGGLGTSVYF